MTSNSEHPVINRGRSARGADSEVEGRFIAPPPQDAETEAAIEEISTQNGVEGPSETDIAVFMDIAQQLERELCSIVVGQERVIRELLLALLAGGHVVLEPLPAIHGHPQVRPAATRG